MDTVCPSTMERGGICHIILLMVLIQSNIFTKSENDPFLEWCLGAMVYINEKRLHLELKTTQSWPMYQAGIN